MQMKRQMPIKYSSGQGEAAQLVKEGGKDGAPTPPTTVTVASPQPDLSSQTPFIDGARRLLRH